MFAISRWGRRILHPHPEHRLVHDARLFALEPLVPPADALLQETDLRSGLGEMWIFVRPGADQLLPGTFEIGNEPEDGIGIAIRPAADRIDRALDGAPVL